MGGRGWFVHELPESAASRISVQDRLQIERDGRVVVSERDRDRWQRVLQADRIPVRSRTVRAAADEYAIIPGTCVRKRHPPTAAEQVDLHEVECELVRIDSRLASY